MNITGNTILITGGGSGIGLEVAKALSALGNTVIITGRNEEKLKNAMAYLEHGHYVVADVTNDGDVDRLVATVNAKFPGLNILLNNAGQAFIHDLQNSADAAAIAKEEMAVNYLAAVNLTTRLLPLLKKQPESAIVNVSSLVALAPALLLPTYSASKAALHSYTQALRLSLGKNPNVRVFEVLPPLVDTDLAMAITSKDKISPKEVAKALIVGLQINEHQIHVASTDGFFKAFFSNTDKAVAVLNGLHSN